MDSFCVVIFAVVESGIGGALEERWHREKELVHIG
jgi:hypothetical protein